MKRLLVYFVLVFAATDGSAQEWQWRWGTQASNHAYDSYLSGLAADRYNNISGWFMYDTVLYLPDTVIHHPVSSGGFAVPVFNSNGQMIKVIDLWSDTGNVWDPPIVSFDGNGNTYICTTFRGAVFLNDDTIKPAPNVNAFIPQLFLTKLKPDGKMEWSKLIYGNGQVFLDGMVVGPDNMVYLAASSTPTFGPPGWTVFFGQDSITFQTRQTSFMKINPEGIIQWRKPVKTDYPYLSGILRGEDGNIYLYGASDHDVIAGTDTVRHVGPNHTAKAIYLVGFDTLGMLKRGYFQSLNVQSYEMVVDEAGALYFSGFIYDNLYWGGSQVVIAGDTTCMIFGKVSPEGQPLWYNLAKTRKNPGMGEMALNFKLGLSGDSLAFAAGCSRHFRLNDSVYYVGEASEVITGICAPDGQILKTLVSRNTYGMQCTDLIMDHCKNIIISGGFRDSTWFGPDTLKSYSFVFNDGYIANLGRFALPSIELGADTTVCESIDLSGPSGFAYYRWNDGLSTSRNLHVTNTGKYWLSAAGSDLCWATDTILVNVDRNPVVDLGGDTSILRKDHIVYSMLPGYDLYIWSTGDTARQFVVYGDKLGFGDHEIWVTVWDGSCEVSDTVIVKVIPGIGFTNPDERMNRIYPNPASGILTVECDQKIQSIQIKNLLGRSSICPVISGLGENLQRLDLSALAPGMYITVVTTNGDSRSHKVVIAR